MPHSAIISIGDELLSGRTLDTNAHWLAGSLRAWGFPSIHRETVSDEEARIAESLLRATDLADLIVVTGGLGPTPDDLTRLGLARALKVSCVRHAKAEKQVRERFEHFGRPVTETNLVQADLPEGTEPLENFWGSAPGVLAHLNQTPVFVFPGVPKELKLMAERHLHPHCTEHLGSATAPEASSLTVCGIPESQLGELLGDLMTRGRNPKVGSYPGISFINVGIEAVAEDGRSAQQLLDADLAEIRQRLGHRVIGEGQLQIHEVVAKLLMDGGETLAVAESLTGGRIADLLVSVAGISSIFLAGFTTYANSAKTALLGVPESMLAAHGAVSKEVAVAMAEGARQRAGSDVALSTTGIAGPSGGSKDKPVGTVWMALATSSQTYAHLLQTVGDREDIRQRATTAALDMLRRYLQGLLPASVA